MSQHLYCRFSPSSAVTVLDYKVCDLRRQLDKLRSKNNSQSKYLALLLSESEKIKETADNEVSPTLRILGAHTSIIIQEKNFTMTNEEQRQRYLENEIHKITLKMMEGEMVRKKYDVIHDMLKKEQVHYARQQMELEAGIKSQQKELGELKLHSNSF